ncbi:MAG: class I SAM-dependent methyltransferase [Propionibacteriaceae bacterium]|jgi:methylase of polypeptide subunit release factors|nr:class I SAM-dependent methyltransferase [Propionibacteriaceae bacterium]
MPGNPRAESVELLRAALVRADYFADPVLEAITVEGQRGLTRNHTFAASRALGSRDDPLATIIRLFILQEEQPLEAVIRAGVVDLVNWGLLTRSGDMFRAGVDIRPYSDETAWVDGWVVSDHAATLNTRNVPPSPDHVLGVSAASVSLSQITPRRQVESALDLGTGSGIQCLHLSHHALSIVATDVNKRALDLAQWTCDLNDVRPQFRLGSLYEPVGDEKFDLITTNPPFVMSPVVGERLTYRETGYSSDEFMRAVVSGAGDPLNPGGSLHVLGNWAHVRGEPWQERLRSWVPVGCDAFVVQREVLDVCEYIEIWLADAGLNGTDSYLEKYQQWLDYFDTLGVEAVGMGWIAMVKSGSAIPRVTCLDWPHAVAQPVADDLMAHLDAMQYESWSDERVLDTTWILAPGTTQETMGAPGAADPSHIVLRRQDGLKRAVEVDTGLGGVLGACDGDLPLGAIIAAVAEVLDVSAPALVAEIVPQVRDLIATTWLTPVPQR